MEHIPVQVEKVATLAGHADCVYAVCGTDQDHEVISAGGDGMVVLWDLRMPDLGKLVAQIPASVYALDFSEAHQLLITGHNHDGIHLIDWESKKEIGSRSFTQSQIFDLKVVGDTVIAACGDGTVTALSIPELDILWSHQLSNQRARRIAIHPQLPHIAIGYSDAVIRIWDLDNQEVLYQLHDHQASVFALSYSPNGDHLLSAGRDAHLKQWNVHDHYFVSKDIPAHMYAINDLKHSPDGKWIATVSMDKSVKLWDAETLTLRKVIDKARHAGHGTSVNAVYWSRFNQQIITASDDRKLAVWQAAL